MVETLGHYRILDRIGAGHLGELYRARDTRLGRTAAIRVVSPDIANDPDRRTRLVSDARAATALSHPNIAALYEVGDDPDRLFLVSEFVPGERLKRAIGGRPLHPRRAVDLAAQIAAALAEAHAHGMVHRALTSENIVVTPKEKAKILDFGLTATAGAAADHDREQADQAGDIAALGTVLFEMLTGRLPLNGAGKMPPAAAPSTVNRTVPPELDRIVAKALGSGYESAAILAAELRSVAGILDARAERSESSGRALPPARPRPHSHLQWIVLAIAAAAALAAALWLGGSLL